MFREKPLVILMFCAVVAFATVLLQLAYPRHALLDATYVFAIFGVIILAVVYIKKLYTAIASEKQQSIALIENTTEGIILSNQKGEIVLINPAASAMFGYEPQELLCKQVDVLSYGRHRYARHKDGRELPVEVSLSFYTQRDERFAIAFITDITQRKESEQRLLEQTKELERVSSHVQKLNTELENKVTERTLILREALQELEKSQHDLSEALNKEKELNEIKSRFVSTASHEFRTPLSTVLSSAALLSKYVKEEEQDKRDKHIRRIKDSVRHLNDLLEDFLSLSKLEEGKVQVKPEQVPINEFLEEVVEEIKPVVKPAQHIVLEPEPGMVFVTDKKLLKIILLNLLSNATKFSAENGNIWLRASIDENHLLIAIRDQGIGIPDQDQQHIFASFYRGKNAINIQGTGLGLHIVKAYVELLHGAVRLNSALGKGTTVILDLPALNRERV